MIYLNNSIQPIKDAFNGSSAEVKFLTILSPTWPNWIEVGARAVQVHILQDYPDAQLSILVVWLKMYEIDSFEVPREASGLVSSDPGGCQFYDPARISGLEVANSLGAEPGEVAWDVYMFFDGQYQ